MTRPVHPQDEERINLRNAVDVLANKLRQETARHSATLKRLEELKRRHHAALDAYAEAMAALAPCTCVGDIDCPRHGAAIRWAQVDEGDDE